MTRGDEDIEGGLRKVLETRKGGSEKIRGGLRKFVYFKINRKEACVTDETKPQGLVSSVTQATGGGLLKN